MMKLCVWIFGASFLASVGAAHATTITFDTFAHGTVITNQYAGLNFSASSGGGGRIFQTTEASSPPKILIANSSSFDPITIDFLAPVNQVSMDLISVGWATVTANALAANLSTILATVSVTHNGVAPSTGLNNIDPINLVAAGIARVTIFRSVPFSGDGFGIDNLFYSADVPTPGTTALLGLGLLGVAWVRRRIPASSRLD